MNKVIAMDFDGCLCENAWPEIGKPNLPVIERARREKAAGAKLILWTCREGDMLKKAIAWCAGYGLSFAAHNENLPELTELYGNDCRKVGADEYWDDRAVRITFEEAVNG